MGCYDESELGAGSVKVIAEARESGTTGIIMKTAQYQ